ncbi:MM3350-like domain-containing protein [Mycena albidolilacea]|uniref:MM3350-like domain-containing protein n=1 Tax=Mycena albidolilacea TaxID=1033008 RepID=A0AAD6ZLC7_9AGAR|nr:MM3350-like domain-containing protein [Mycena albidolilacea]
MEDMLRALQGTTIASTRPPAFIKLAPNDDGSSLPAAFFEHPDTYIKHVGPDGRIRSWGFYPYIPRGQQGAGHEDIPYPMMRKMMHQMTYAPLNRSSQLLRPEDQFMNTILARRKRELKQVNLGDLTRRDYVLRIHMPVRNFHAHILTDYRDGTQYGPKVVQAISFCLRSLILFQNSGAIDMMHIDASGYDFLNEDDYCVAHVMDKVGDACQYEYDLGDHFRHDIIVERIVPLEESYGRVQVLGGSGICPMENGKGNDTWAKHIETLTKSGTPAARRGLLSEIYSMPNYTDRGWNKASKFDPDYFDLAEMTQAVMAALGTKLSYSPGAKTFKVPFVPEALLGPLSASKRKTTREVTMSPGDSFGFYEELKKDGRDSRRATACAACGNPNDLKACSGCGQRFYCGQACQKAHWKSTHKQECAMAKKQNASG